MISVLLHLPRRNSGVDGITAEGGEKARDWEAKGSQCTRSSNENVEQRMAVMMPAIMRAPVASVQEKEKKRKTRLWSNNAFKYLEARGAQETVLRKEELQLRKEKES